ncbi:uncharacterized protein LOC132656493 [Meriones unguiculatus]|uniref:uncharacterized protein LOC132656493 n=1 Tax=Meriones unguiculatus TaxID=10047 RepID=UPI00293E85B8|nr:uncharacterized protein LOC132656493 [Meriones unguiculatus]XP_060247317.1 uncharacterized protein LOC132656493 [Meriones unguiculatus]
MGSGAQLCRESRPDVGGSTGRWGLCFHKECYRGPLVPSPSGARPPAPGRPTRLRRRSSSPARPLVPPPATTARSRAPGSSRPPFLPCPGPRAPMPPELLPASSQERGTAVACEKLRFPPAALAAGCAPPRPRRILRSPCRPAAISDRRRRNLPKTRAGNGRTCARLRGESTEVFVTFRTHPKAEEVVAVGSAFKDPRRRLGAR